MDKDTRKKEVNLSTLGTGVILFGAWDLIKFILTYLMYKSELEPLIPEKYKTVILAIVWGVPFVAFLIRLYIGTAAKSESRGKRRRLFYIILSGFLALISTLVVVGEIVLFFMDTPVTLSAIVSLLLDFTSMAILYELIVNAVSIRRYRKKEATA